MGWTVERREGAGAASVSIPSRADAGALGLVTPGTTGRALRGSSPDGSSLREDYKRSLLWCLMPQRTVATIDLSGVVPRRGLVAAVSRVPGIRTRKRGRPKPPPEWAT
jgi:hypothetical protein